MYFRIWKSPVIILLFLGCKAISVAGGKVLSNITVLSVSCPTEYCCVCIVPVLGAVQLRMKYICISFMNR